MDFINAREYRWVAWTGITLVLMGDIIVATQGKWDGVTLLTASALLSMGLLLMENRVASLVVLLLVLATVVNAISFVWNLYDSVWFFDEAMHLYTPLAITVPIGLLLSSAFRMDNAGQKLVFVIAIASVGTALGVAWEIFEWAYDLVTPQGNLIKGKTDTIVDLIMDGFGALVGAYIALRIKETSRSHDQSKRSVHSQDNQKHDSRGDRAVGF